MTNENLSPEQSLQVIQSMIEKAKNQFSENGHLYLLWGWVIFIASAGQFILLNLVHYQNHSIVWFLPWLAVIYQFIYLVKKKKQKRVTTYTDFIIGFVWMTFFILMVLFAFILGQELGSSFHKLVCPVALALYGMPTLLSGIILRFRPLIAGAIGCWLLSIGSLYIHYDYQLLFLSAAMVIAWIIPGYILRSNYQKQKD
ncbi:MAG TPA: hypothetical protein VK483_00665 [Chitinophagaceae bacterium]|nr:hypothetical protein [Chitinophagaceae bacterium]